MESERSTRQPPTRRSWWNRLVAACRSRWTNADRYELVGNLLARRAGKWTRESVFAGDVESWWVERQPVFDVVHIRLHDGRVLHWPDDEYQLLPLLDKTVHNKGFNETVSRPPADALPNLDRAAT